MRIAVCDDEAADRAALEGVLRQYGSDRGLDFDIRCFDTAESYLPSPSAFDVTFMDVLLPGMNGIEAVQEATQGVVVFTTISRDYAVEAFQLGAVHYLVKPLQADEVARAMDRALDALGHAPAAVLELKTAQGIVPVPMALVRFIEVKDKVCEVHLEDDVLRVPMPLASLRELLDDALFLQVQRSFVVNMRHIDSFLADRVVMSDGTVISLSRPVRADLRQRYQRFLFDLARKGTSSVR